MVCTEAECLHHKLPPIRINLSDFYPISPMSQLLYLKSEIVQQKSTIFPFQGFQVREGDKLHKHGKYCIYESYVDSGYSHVVNGSLPKKPQI